MSPRILLSLSLLLLTLGLPCAWGEQIEGLYTVAIPVSSQSSKVLRSATREGLATVLLRVSGHGEMLADPAIKAAVKDARRYMKQFQYEQVAVARGDTVLDQGDRPIEQLMVLIEFEPKLIEQLLRGAGLPFWSSNRPAVLVWMVVEDGDGRRFVGAGTDPAIIQAVMANTTRRGLPLTLPALDLEDMVAVSPDELWRLNNHRALAAVERYQASSMLLGRVSQLSNGQWLGRWNYHLAGQRLRFDGDAESIDAYVAAAIDQVADLMAAQYAIAPVDIAEGGLLMRLAGVKDFSDYAQAVSYLEGLAAIHHANVVHIEGDEIILRLTADGLLPQLQQVLARDQRLLAVPLQDYQGEYPIVLDYQWLAVGQL